jgi:Protein of unknown function (DUF2637)
MSEQQIQPGSWSSVRIDRTRAVAEERRRDADAATERRLREAEARTRLAQDQRAASLVEARELAQVRRDARAARRVEREKRHAKWAEAMRRVVSQARTNAAATWSSVVYGLAVAVAAAGQVSLAEKRGLPWFAGLGIAGFVEGLALAMALTARSMRLSGERARIPRILTWVAAVFAAGINLYAHRSDPVEAAVFAAASIAGITLWEIRGEAKTRDQMRQVGAAMRTQRAEDLVLSELAGVIETEARDAAAAGDTDAALAALGRLEILHRRATAVRTAAVLAADQFAADPIVVPVSPSPETGTGAGTGTDHPALPSPSRPRRATGRGPSASRASSPPPDVSDLMADGRAVARALAAAGEPLTRDRLIAGLRARDVAVSTTRASALRHALNAEPHPIPDPPVTDESADDEDAGGTA